MLTKFEGMPQLFVDLYRPQLMAWAIDFRRRGPVQRVVLKDAPGVPVEMNPDAAQGKVIKFVMLRAEHQTNVATRQERMRIWPETDDDREKIARHCHEMRGTILQ